MTGPGLHRTDGDGWVECSCGEKHWGRYGAAGLMVVTPGSGVLLQHRATWSHHGGTWGVPGGARASGEDALTAALREAAEEAAVDPTAVRPRLAWVEDHGEWSYTTVVAEAADGRVEARASDPESLEIRWVAIDDVNDLPLLPAFGQAWPKLREQLGRRLVVVVDAANVVGSRPDGWWRDRRGANQRLLSALARLGPVPAAPFGVAGSYWWPDRVMVVEGQANAIDDLPGDDANRRVRLVRAEAGGDDTIVAVTAEHRREHPLDHVVVVTADRGLRARVTVTGAGVVGPSVVRSLLDAPGRD